MKRKIKHIYKCLISVDWWLDVAAAFLRFLIKRNPIGLFKKGFNRKHPYWAASTSLTLIILILSGSIWLVFLRTPKTQAAWWNDSWMYRKRINLTNSGSVQTNYQVPITIDTQALISSGKMQGTCNDIRITDANGKMLPYWVSGCNTASTVVWPRIPTLPTAGAILYLYYGNLSAPSGKIAIGTENFPALSCKSILDAGNGTTNQKYWLDTTNGDFGDKYQAYCDMTNDSGGWMLVTQSMINSESATNVTNTKSADANGGLIYQTTIAAPGDCSTHNAKFYLNDVIPWSKIKADYTFNGGNSCWSIFGNTGYGADVNLTQFASATDTIRNQVKMGGSNGDNYDGINTKCDNETTNFWHSNRGVGTIRSAQTILRRNSMASLAGLGFGAACVTTGYGLKYENIYIREDSITYATISNSIASEEQAPAPVAYWKFDEGNGTTVNDSTGNGINGTKSAGAVWKNESECVSGKCLYFAGNTSSYVDYGNVFTDSVIKNEMTVEAWFKADSLAQPATDGVIVSKRQYSVDNSAWSVYVNSSGVNWAIHDDSNSGYVQTASVNANTWNHVVGVWNNGVQKLYLNGKLISNNSRGFSKINDSTGKVYVGIEDTAVNRYFKGFVDDVKIYRFEKSADQIKMDYNAGLAGSAAAEGAAQSFGGKSDKWMSDGLVGYWKMDEASWNGTAGEVKDASGNNNNGTSSGGATTATGKYGNGGSFDRTDDYVSVANASSLNVSNVTLSAWVKPTALPGSTHQRIMTKNSTSGYLLNIYDSYFEVYVGGQNLTGTTLTAGQWAHLVATTDGNRMKLYKDGEKVADAAYTGSINCGSGNLNIAADGGTSLFGGSMDEVRVYNRALSPEEVRKLYGYAPGPIAYYKLDEKSGSTFSDSSSNGYGGTLVNNPSWTNGKYGSGLSLASNYGSIADNASMRPGTGDFTASFWIKTPFATNGSGAWPNIFLKGLTTSAAANTWGFLGQSSSTNRINFSQSSDAGGSFDVSLSTGALSDGWHYITARRSGTTTRLYADGVFVSEDTTAGSNLSSASNFYIGGNTANSAYFLGQIDEIKYYNYARTVDQIVEDMNSGGSDADSGGATIEPLAYWKLDESSGTTISDSSGHGYNLTRYNGAAVYNNGKFNKAIDFDGLNDFLGSGSVSDPFEYRGDNLTLSLWINKDAGETDGGNLICKPWNGGGQYNYCINVTSGGNVGVSLVGATSWSTSVSSIIASGIWTHLVVTIDGATKAVKIYKDGVLVKSDTHNISNWTPSSGDGNIAFSLGTLYPYGEGWAGNTGFSFDGKIDEVKFYNATLSEDEVEADFNQGKSAVMSVAGMTAGGSPDASANAEYCIPGDSSLCSAPVGEWKFDEGSGTSVADSSGGGNAGTWVGTGTHWAIGKIGKTGIFNGSDDGVTLNSTYTMTNGDWAVSAWVKTSASNGSVLSNNSGGPVSSDMGMVSGHIYYANYDGAWKYHYGAKTVNDGKWHHLTWVNHSGNTMDMYVDGVAETGNGFNSYTTNGGPVNSIGKSYAYLTNGSIDNVRLYNYARTPAQVAYDFNRGAPIGWWKFDECQGSTANDSSGSNNNATITIGATGTQASAGTCSTSSTAWGNGANGKFNGSLNFDGTDDYGSVDLRNLGLTKSQTITAWTKSSVPLGGQAHQTILSTDPNHQYGVKLMNYKNYARVGLWLGTGSTNYEAFVDKNVNDGQWHFIAGAYDYDAGIVRIFIDGVSYPTINAGQMLINVSATGLIGREYHSAGNNYSFNGQIDDIRMYNYALTDAQMKNVMNEGSALRFGN